MDFESQLLPPIKKSTRPPSQYVVAPGSQYRLVANEYDKNTYAQCNYASNRTLIRCKQIRSKEALSKNNGRCEEHAAFSKFLESNHKREVMRCHAENDSKMQRRRFDPWIASNEYISDEDDYLLPAQEAPQLTPDTSNNSILDNHPLRYAGTYTDKDVLKIQTAIVEQDLNDLVEFKRLLVAQAQKEHGTLGDDEEEDCPTDMVQRRNYKAAAMYGKNDYLVLPPIDPVFKECCVGPDMDDKLVIAHIVHSLLDKLDNRPPMNVDVKCPKSALHLTSFCIEHITLDRNQKLFGVCTECGETALGGDHPKCSAHLKCLAKTQKKVCKCSKCMPASTPKDDKRVPTRADFEVSDDEEALGNLSQFESMVSPMTQFSSPLSYQPSTSSSPYQKQPIRRYQGMPAQILRPPQLGPPPGMNTSVPYLPIKNRTAATNQPQLTLAQIQEKQRLQAEEDEEKTKTCARVHPVDRHLYGHRRDTKNLRQSRPQSVMGQNPGFKKLPIRMSASESPTGNMTFQGWRNQGTSSIQRPLPQPGAYMQPLQYTRYPIHQNRPLQPKMIPLERVQEPRNLDEFHVDDGRFHQGSSEPQRRNVPYYRNPTLRRAEPPPRHPSPLTPSNTISSSQLLAQSPSPTVYRPMSRLPMAPHRAIAAGLNPAEVGAVPPRPVYRVPNPIQRPAPYTTSPANRGSMTASRGSPHVVNRMIGGGGGGIPRGGGVVSSYMAQGAQRRSFGLPSGPSGPPGGPSTSSSGESGDAAPPYCGPLAKPQFKEEPTAASTTAPPLVLERKSPKIPWIDPSKPHHPSLNAIKSLDSARTDERFANINVKTFLSMSNQPDLERMTKEEIELMAAASESQEKGPRKSVVAAFSSGVPSNVNLSRPFPANAPKPPYPRAPKVKPTIPDAVQDVVSTPSIDPPFKVPDAVKDVVSTPSISGPLLELMTPVKRKLDDSGSDATEPTPKKVAATGAGQETPAKEKVSPKTAPKPSPLRRKTPPNPRAAARIAAAANQKTSTPSTSSAPSSSSSAPPPPPPEPEATANPLDLLAELSAAAEAEEVLGKATPPAPVVSTRTSSGSNRRTPKKLAPPTSSSSSSTVTPRRLSAGKKNEDDV